MTETPNRVVGALYSKLTGDKVADVEYVLTSNAGRIWIGEDRYPGARFIGRPNIDTGDFIYVINTSSGCIELCFDDSLGRFSICS